MLTKKGEFMPSFTLFHNMSYVYVIERAVFFISTLTEPAYANRTQTSCAICGHCARIYNQTLQPRVKIHFTLSSTEPQALNLHL